MCSPYKFGSDPRVLQLSEPPLKVVPFIRGTSLLRIEFTYSKHQIYYKKIRLHLGTASSFIKLTFWNFPSKLMAFDVTKIFMQKRDNNFGPKKLTKVACEMDALFQYKTSASACGYTSWQDFPVNNRFYEWCIDSDGDLSWTPILKCICFLFFGFHIITLFSRILQRRNLRSLIASKLLQFFKISILYELWNSVPSVWLDNSFIFTTNIDQRTTWNEQPGEWREGYATTWENSWSSCWTGLDGNFW